MIFFEINFYKIKEVYCLLSTFSVMAKTVDNTDGNSVIDYDVTSFLYSKHQAEDELKLVESKLRENGIPLEEFEGRKSVAWSYTIGNKSTTSEQTKGKKEKYGF